MGLKKFLLEVFVPISLIAALALTAIGAIMQFGNLAEALHARGDLLSGINLVFLSLLLLSFFAAGLQFTTFSVTLALTWILLSLPPSFRSGDAHSPALALSMLLPALALLRSSSILPILRRRKELCFECRLALFFFWSLFVSDVITSMRSGVPLFVSYREPRYSPLSEPLSCMGAYALLLVATVRMSNVRVNWGKAAGFTALVITGVSLIRYFMNNHPTFGFTREFHPISTFSMPAENFGCLLYMLLSIVTLSGGVSLPAWRRELRSLAILALCLTIVLSFDLLLWGAVMIFLTVWIRGKWPLSRRDWGAATLYLSFSMGAFACWRFQFNPSSPTLAEQFSRFVPAGHGSALLAKSLFGTPLLGIGPWFKEIVFEKVRVYPENILVSPGLELIAYGGLLLFIPMASVLVAFIRMCVRERTAIAMGLVLFLLDGRMLLRAETVLILFGVLSAAPLWYCDAERREAAPRVQWFLRCTAVSMLVLALGAGLATISSWRQYQDRAGALETVLANPGEPVPETFIYALLIMEDNKFFQHHGLDFGGINRSIWKNMTSGRFIQGASTISMQLAKLLFLSDEKTLFRKFRQVVLALIMERQYTKGELLELYVNLVDFGATSPGIATAAQQYFKKSVDHLSIQECLQLVVTLQNPSRYNPSLPLSADLREKLYQLQGRVVQDWFLFRQEVENLQWTKKEPYYD